MALVGLALALGLARVGLAALGPGSCAFIEINGQGPDNFKLVLLEPMSAGETIKVTFRMVDGNGDWIGASTSDDLTYTASSCLLPGVTLAGVQHQTTGNAFSWPTWKGGPLISRCNGCKGYLCCISLYL